jgi:hypothetical protein
VLLAHVRRHKNLLYAALNLLYPDDFLRRVLVQLCFSRILVTLGSISLNCS